MPSSLPQTIVTSPYRLVPGPYAAHLIENGMAEAQALADAQAFGEQPTWQAAEVELPQHLSSYQIYAREKGIYVPSESEPSITASRSQ